MLLLVCLIPLTIMIVYLLLLMNRFSSRYDGIVSNITMANAYNLTFKEDMDYLMYIIVVNSERAEELVDTEQPYVMIEEAREDFRQLYDKADADYARNCLNGILKSLNSLEDRVEEIENDALVSGSYDENMERLDMNIRILTELIQDQIQRYIYYEATNLQALREEIRGDVAAVFRAFRTGELFRSVSDDGWKDEFVVFVSLIGISYGLQSRGRKFAGAGGDGVVCLLNAVPALVSVHGIIPAGDGGDSSRLLFRHIFLQL